MRLAKLLPRPATAMIAAAFSFFVIAVIPPQPRAGGLPAGAPHLIENADGVDVFMAPSFAAPIDLTMLDIR